VRSIWSEPARRSTDREPRRRRFLAVGTALACVAAVLGVGAPAASAAPTATTAYKYQTSFGAGELTFGFGFQGSIPSDAVAVDQSTGNILASNEFFGEVVQLYSPDPVVGGTPLTSFASGITSNIATDSSAGALYTERRASPTAVLRLISDGQPTPSYTLDPGFTPVAGEPYAIAVDPTNGDLVTVASDRQTIERFDSTGAFVSSFTAPEGAHRVIAIGLDGTIYLDGHTAGLTNNNGKILRFAPDGTRLSDLTVVEGSEALSGVESNVVALTVNPASGDLLAAVKTGEGPRLMQFSPTGQKLFDVPRQPGGTVGIAIDAATNRVYSYNEQTPQIDTYVPAPYAGVEPATISGVTSTGLHASTEVDPGEESGGGTPSGSGVRFEYREAGASSWTKSTDQPVNAPGTFTADVDGLEPNLTYEIRAVAFNDFTEHLTDPVSVHTVATAPRVNTGAATDVSETGAVLNGTINPLGLQTTYHFEYGLTTTYGSRLPIGIDGTAGGTHEVRSFSRSLDNLAAGTTYHFRLVATNAIGTTEGVDRTFTTASAGSTSVRAYEQVSPVDKGAAIYPTFGFQVEADGDGFAYQTHGGSESSPIHAQAMSLRGTEDWNGGIDLDPPNTVTPANLFFQSTLAISDDFAHTLVVSNRALRPGAIENGTNLYVVDVPTGKYQLVAATNEPEAFQSFTAIESSNKFVAGAPDFSWVAFNSKAPLVPGAPSMALYRWSEGGGLEVVSRLPDGEMVTPDYKPDSSGSYRQVSADGTRIFFSVSSGSEQGLYLREGNGPSKAISVSEVPGEPTGPQPAVLVGLTKDGRYAFFATSVAGTKLTADADGELGDLYRYDALSGELDYLGVAAVATLAGNSINFGELGTAPDGNTVYFNIRLNPGSEATELWVWHDGVLHRIAPGVGIGPRSGAATYVSPNGRYLAFYEDDGAVQLYDAETEEQSCASCLPDGTPVSATLTPSELMLSNRVPQAVSNDGTVYFGTKGRLVAADVNGTEDVYGYRDGHAHLISPGNAPFDATLAGISEDGRNVFFTTAQSLVGRDGDESVDVYDARINGGLPAQSPPAPRECLRDDCKATPNAGPELPFGGSEALSGPGNVVAKASKRCPKGQKLRKVKGKSRCVKPKKPKKGKKGHKHAGAKRRLGR